MDSLAEAFHTEARLLLHRMEGTLRRYAGEKKVEDLDTLFRDAHTLKSSAQAMGYPKLAAFFHEIEDRCEDARAGKKQEFPSEAAQEALGILRRAEEERSLGDEDVHALARNIWEGGKSKSPIDPLKLPDDIAISRTTYEKLMGAAESIFSAETRVETLGASLLRMISRAGIEGKETLSTEYENAAGMLHRASVELDRRLRDARMTPLAVYFDRLPTVVKALNERLGKEARLSLAGGDIQADRVVINELGGSLEHLVKNAVDHGIEKKGAVRVSAALDHEFVVLAVEDSGRGIAFDRIEAIAREKGYIPKGALVTPELRSELLFHPHLSTKTEVTDISGRGIGMSAVREYVRSVGGRIVVESPIAEYGGTRVTLRIPTALSLERVLLFRSGHSTFGMVERLLKETVPYDPLHVALEQEGRSRIRIGERSVPLVALSAAFGLPTGYFKREQPLVLIVEGARGELGILVDAVLHEEEVLVKTLPRLLSGLRAFSGAAMIGDGRTVLILDPRGLSELRVEAKGAAGEESALSPMDRDQLMEVMNMVASHAGGAIARRLGRPVALSIPECSDGGAGLPEDDWGASAIGVRMILEGAYPGHLLFEMPAPLAESITEAVLGKRAALHELTQEERAFFQELGHIAMHAIGNMLSRISKNPVMTKASDIRVDARGALRTYFLSGHRGNPDDLVRVRLWFAVGDGIRTDDHRGTGSFTIELRRADARTLLSASRQALAS